MTTLYGIPNCDTVRKARKWLMANNVDYHFHDFRKDGLNNKQLKHWATLAGWETLLNRRGTRWRKLSEADKSNLNEAKALKLMLDEPTLIKRPVLEYNNQVHVGFSENDYRNLFN